MTNRRKFLKLSVISGATAFYNPFASGNTLRNITSENKIVLNDRFIAIDNVCAWPNLTVLNDGTIIASIFNKPSHGRGEGDVECWASQNGHFWKKRGVPSRHTPKTNRMNVAAGLAIG